MSETVFSAQYAYQAMIAFLEGHYDRTGSADIAGLLGDMAQREDGSTADPAMWADWVNCLAHLPAQAPLTKAPLPRTAPL
jgi:hypothetical protein